MDLRRLRNGEWIAGAAGAALIVALFLPWYGGDGSRAAASGWESFTVVDVILCVCGLFGVALWFLTALQKTPAVPLGAAGLCAWAGVLATVVVLWRVAFPPADGLTREWGLYLALVAAVGLFTGAWRSLGDERIRRPDGRWSRAAGGELGAGVDVKLVAAPSAGLGSAEGR